MFICFIYNLSKKAKCHHLIALLPVFTLCSVFIYDVTLSVLEIQRGGSLGFIVQKMISLILIRINHNMLKIKMKTYHLEFIDLCIVDFLKTRLSLAVT